MLWGRCFCISNSCLVGLAIGCLYCVRREIAGRSLFNAVIVMVDPCLPSTVLQCHSHEHSGGLWAVRFVAHCELQAGAVSSLS